MSKLSVKNSVLGGQSGYNLVVYRYYLGTCIGIDFSLMMESLLCNEANAIHKQWVTSRPCEQYMIVLHIIVSNMHLQPSNTAFFFIDFQAHF